MPPRLVSVAILLYWVAAASSLIQRDVLPEMGFVRPPDFRSIARAEMQAEPSHWLVEVIDNPLAPDNRRPVGQASTDSSRSPDGWLYVSSRVSFDTGGLLRGTPYAKTASEKIEVRSDYRVDPSGNLRSFHATVRSPGDPKDLLTVDGELKNQMIEITTRGRLEILNQKRSLPYPPRGLVQNALGPFDRLPGLQVGQRWETRMVSPITGGVETVRVEVTRRCVINWHTSPISVFEVVHHATPFLAKTWVRPDGLVLRQEVPFPFVKLVLERQPDHSTEPEVRD